MLLAKFSLCPRGVMDYRASLDQLPAHLEIYERLRNTSHNVWLALPIAPNQCDQKESSKFAPAITGKGKDDNEKSLSMNPMVFLRGLFFLDTPWLCNAMACHALSLIGQSSSIRGNYLQLRTVVHI